jgi:hypothetical protein
MGICEVRSRDELNHGSVTHPPGVIVVASDKVFLTATVPAARPAAP